MKLNMTVEYADGSRVPVVASTRDLSAFEETFDKAFVGGVELRIKEIAWLAWHSLVRRSGAPSDFDAWWDTVEDVDLGGASEPVPLESTPPTS